MEEAPELNPQQQEFCNLLHQWLAAELVALYRLPVQTASRNHLLLGGAVWGEKYVRRFLDYTLPSLRSPANWAALRNRACMMLFTAPQDFDALWREAQRMTAEGVPTQVMIIPPPILAGSTYDEQAVFPLLGTTQVIQVQTAARHGMAYHSLFPDYIYSSHYFKNLFRLAKKHPSIVQSSISANIHAVAPEVEAYRKDDALTVDAVSLTDMGWRHLHAQSRGNLMNNGKAWLGLPSSFQCIYQGRDRLYLHCCHTNPVYLAPELCVAAPVRYFSPIDCNLPYICGDEFHFPTVEDEMSFLEISDEGKKGISDRVSDELHAAICWHHVKFRMIYLPWYAAPCEVPIRPQAEYMDAGAIKAKHAAVVANVVDQREAVRGRIRVAPRQAA